MDIPPIPKGNQYKVKFVHDQRCTSVYIQVKTENDKEFSDWKFASVFEYPGNQPCYYTSNEWFVIELLKELGVDFEVDRVKPIESDND